MDDRALLAAAGETLFGPEHWKAELARALGVSRRSLVRWHQTGEIPEGVWRDLNALLAERALTLADVRDQIAKRNRT